MDNNDIFDNELVDKFDAEDTIFNNCMNDFDEFPKYITKYDDINGHYNSKFMSPAFRNLNVDSVWKRKNNSLVNIEHHSILNSTLLRRDYTYVVELHEASKLIVEPYIFNTGHVPRKKIEFSNSTMFYNPVFFNTQEIDGTVNLNNLRYKVYFKQELTERDALDLIWLVKFNIDTDREGLLYELTADIWAKAVAKKWILDAIRKNLIIWAKKYLTDKEKIEKFTETVKMSKIEIRSFERQMWGAGIAGELERAEERGHKEGLKEGHKEGLKEGHKEGLKEGHKEGHEKGIEQSERKFVKKLLEKLSPQEISKEFEIPLKRVLEIRDNNS